MKNLLLSAFMLAFLFASAAPIALTAESKDACIEACSSCESVCLKTISYCLDKGGKHATKDHIQLMMDCAVICDTCEKLDATNSPLQKKMAQLCAEMCEKCAASCEKLKDKGLQECIDACRSCASTCAKTDKG